MIIYDTFQSTPSSRRETLPVHDGTRHCRISIHSLLAEGDIPRRDAAARMPYFNPLPPRGGRRKAVEHAGVHCIFQSTPSSRRETRPTAAKAEKAATISIHSLLAEGDTMTAILPSKKSYFNPLPPRGGRPVPRSSRSRRRAFQSTPSSRRETGIDHLRVAANRFQSTPSSRRETSSHLPAFPRSRISIHSLLAEGDEAKGVMR